MDIEGTPVTRNDTGERTNTCATSTPRNSIPSI